MLRQGFCLVVFFLTGDVFARQGEKTNAEGEQFLQENKQREGVIVLPSGIQYVIHRNGTGYYHPKADADVKVQYRGSLIDGSIFDESYSRKEKPMFNAKGMIIALSAPPALKADIVKLLHEALQDMTEGAHWTIWLPAAYGFGDDGAEPKTMNVKVPIGPGEVLVFELELLEIKGPKRRAPAFKCELDTRVHCLDYENKLIDGFKDGTVAEMKVEQDKQDAIFWNEEPLKPEERLQAEDSVKILGRLMKQAKKAAKRAKKLAAGKTDEL